MPVQGMLWTSHWLDVNDGADLSATVVGQRGSFLGTTGGAPTMSYGGTLTSTPRPDPYVGPPPPAPTPWPPSTVTNPSGKVTPGSPVCR